MGVVCLSVYTGMCMYRKNIFINFLWAWKKLFEIKKQRWLVCENNKFLCLLRREETGDIKLKSKLEKWNIIFLKIDKGMGN